MTGPDLTIKLFTLLLFASTLCAQDASKRIGEIEFFGYAGIDLIKVRASLPVREGDPFDASDVKVFETIERIKEAINASTSRPPTDVAPVCCDDQGNYMIYIGLAGNSTRKTAYNAAPKGVLSLPPNILSLYKESMELSSSLVAQGRATEDRSKGYALSTEESLRTIQLKIRDFALRHERLLSQVLRSSADPQQRTVAAHLMGYALQSRSQIADLVWATRDAHDAVRNNAIRALGVLAESNSKFAKHIPAEPFIEMLNSGVWTDRNKGGYVLEQLSKSRSPKLLSLLRSQALEALIQMARWRSSGHAGPARTMLGRIAGIEENRLKQIVAAGEIDEILNSLTKN